MSDPGQSFAPGGTQTFEKDRRTRIHRRRLVGFAVSIGLWLLSAVPLSLLASDEGGGTGIAVTYLAAGLGIAALSRGIYALVTKRPFLSPWLFVIAAVLAIMSYGVQSAGDNVAKPAAAGGLVASEVVPPIRTP
jgi:hypothetical protein